MEYNEDPELDPSSELHPMNTSSLNNKSGEGVREKSPSYDSFKDSNNILQEGESLSNLDKGFKEVTA